MSGKYFLVDTTKCTACRGCQIACKEWHKLPAEKTKQYGSYQNPANLNDNTWRLVRFAEHPAKTNQVNWLFFSDSCRQCLDPPCKQEADLIVKDAIIVDRNGAVLYTEKTKELKNAAEAIKDACPWSIPNWSPKAKRLVKCTMCAERVDAGLLPACAKACPTGALNFGDEAAIKKLAKARLAEAKNRFGQAEILDADDVRVLYLVVHDYSIYLKSA